MARIVMKFGGTSTADNDCLRICAEHIAREVKAGYQVAVVVSAPAGMTNELGVRMAKLDPDHQHKDEADLVLSSGEQINAGLLVMMLRQMGYRARSWTGWQAGLITDDNHGQARLRTAASQQFCDDLDRGNIAVLTGFQGVTITGKITTLGRGGSDVSAVALAAAIAADRCDIYTDVDGVFTADPSIVPEARLISRLSASEMLEMASNGAKVLHSRAVELALAENLDLRVTSTFKEGPGTEISEGLENHLVSGIAYSRDQSRVSLTGLKRGTGAAQKIFAELAIAGINSDLLALGPASDLATFNLVFATSRQDHGSVVKCLRQQQLAGLYKTMDAKENMARISVVGLGLRSQYGMADRFFSSLASAGIIIDAVATSELRISALITDEQVESAVRALHFAFALDGNPK